MKVSIDLSEALAIVLRRKLEFTLNGGVNITREQVIDQVLLAMAHARQEAINERDQVQLYVDRAKAESEFIKLTDPFIGGFVLDTKASRCGRLVAK